MADQCDRIARQPPRGRRAGCHYYPPPAQRIGQRDVTACATYALTEHPPTDPGARGVQYSIGGPSGWVPAPRPPSIPRWVTHVSTSTDARPARAMGATGRVVMDGYYRTTRRPHEGRIARRWAGPQPGCGRISAWGTNPTAASRPSRCAVLRSLDTLELRIWANDDRAKSLA